MGYEEASSQSLASELEGGSVWRGLWISAAFCTLSSFFSPHIYSLNSARPFSHHVRGWRAAAGSGGAAPLARCADRGLGLRLRRVPAPLRVPGVGAGERPLPGPQQAGPVGRWDACANAFHLLSDLQISVCFSVYQTSAQGKELN